MNPISRLLLLSCLACAFACSVPTLEELEAESPAGCNAEHPCPGDMVCFDNRCIRAEGLDCRPGTRVACGTDEGECVQGTRLCGADGTFGACEGGVRPARPVCGQSKDNNCDGLEDWASMALTKSHDLGTFLAAVPVRRPAPSTEDTLLVVTTESGSLATRTVSIDGLPSQGEKLSPSAQSIKFQKPSLVAAGDRAMVAWIEETFVQTTGARLYKVYLAQLDGTGKRTSVPVLDLPFGSTQPIVSEVKLAINTARILVLVTTVGAFDPAGPPPTTEVWAITVARDLHRSSVSIPVRLAVPASSFGLHATANGTGEQFLVAFESNHVRQTALIANDGTLVGSVMFQSQDAFTHSPFIVPTRGSPAGHTLHYVQNGVTSPNSNLMTVACKSTGCETPTSIHPYPREIQRMQMVTRPGELNPALSLWSWKDASSGVNYLTLASLSGTVVERVSPLRVSSMPTFSETLVLMPDLSRYVLFHQNPPPSAVGASVSEAYVLPFCGP
jgi:hypothetical protein